MTHQLRACAACALLLALSVSLSAAPPKKSPPPVSSILDEPLRPTVTPKITTQGIFKDASGAAHDWDITPAHVLEWEGKPYLPVGGAWTPKSWADGAEDANWEADKKSLDALKKSGVLDLYLYAGEKGLTHVPTAAVQRVLDYLDANGFRYGIEIADFPKDPLIGYVIKPSVYRDPSPPTTGGPVEFKEIKNLAAAFYVLSSSKGEIDAMNAARVTGPGTASATIDHASPDDVLLLYPQRFFESGTPESHLPDLWQGYDEYRDRLLSFFAKVKLGPGFRFFLDPLTDKIGMNGEVENLIPTTGGFRLDFQAWLDKKYHHNLDDLNKAWDIQDRDLTDFAVAARCIPLWFQSKGVQSILDPDTKMVYTVGGPKLRSRFWDDLTNFRLESVRGYMNSIADALKKGVANVPVVYKWTEFGPLFAESGRTQGGYDGLGMEAYGHGRTLATESGAYTFAQAEDRPMTTWLIVSGTQETENLAEKTTPGYLSKATLYTDWDYLKETGARGFFTLSLQRLPAEKWANVNLANQPEQLGWLAGYAASLSSDPSVQAAAPPPLWYPANAAGLDIGIKTLPGGTRWLPTLRPGGSFSLGANLVGYLIPDPDRRPAYVVWSPHGELKEAQFPWGKEAHPRVENVTGATLDIDHKGIVWTVPISATPILVGHVKTLPLPINVVDDTEKEANRLLKMADEQHIPTQEYKDRVFRALSMVADRPDIADVRYGILSQVVTGLTRVLRPYTWIEAEAASPYTFDAIVPNTDVSGGAFLTLNTDRRPPAPTADRDGGYRAEYTFSVNAPGRYTLWMSGSPLGTPETSAFTYKIDDGVANEIRGAETEGAAYAGRFVWSRLGDVDLKQGSRHKLTIIVTARRPADDHYTLAIDAFCLSRVPFHPDGTRQPDIDTLPPPDVKTADVKKDAR